MDNYSFENHLIVSSEMFVEELYHFISSCYIKLTTFFQNNSAWNYNIVSELWRMCNLWHDLN